MDVKSAMIQRVFFVSAICLLFVTGCGKSGNAPADADSDKSSATRDPAQMLVGVWYGKAQLDQDLLQQKLNATSGTAERNALLTVSQTFQTTEIGARFDADGSMALDIQIQPGGQVLRDSARGTWRTLEVQDNAIVVETTEPLPAGGSETNKVRYQFEQDGQYAIMVAPTSEQLADCHPVFVFERIENSNAKVANGAANSSLK